MNLIPFESGKRLGGLLWLDLQGQRIYRQRSKCIKTGTVYYTCRNETCAATVNKKIDAGFKEGKPHSPLCPVFDRDASLPEEMKVEMRKLAMKTGKVEPSFRTVERKPEYKDVRKTTSLPSMTTNLRRAAHMGLGFNVPTTAEELVELLENPDNERLRMNSDGEPFYIGSVRTSDGHVHVLFINYAVAGEMFDGNHTVNIHLDGTFKPIPVMFRQLLILGVALQRYMFGCIYVLMTRRRLQDYDAVFDKAIEQFPAAQMVKGMIDHEPALRRSAKTKLRLQLESCWSHYSRRIDRVSSKDPLRSIKATSEDAQRLFKMVGALPLLPADLLYRGLAVVRAFAARKVEPHLTAPNVLQLRKFFEYVETKWLDQYGAELSVAGLQRRTNNHAESLNAYLGRVAGNKHLNPIQFIESLKEVNSREATDFSRLYHNGDDPRRGPSTKSRQAEEAIKAGLKKLQESQLSDMDLELFLKSMAHRLQGLIPDGKDDADDEDDGLDDEESVAFRPLVGEEAGFDEDAEALETLEALYQSKGDPVPATAAEPAEPAEPAQPHVVAEAAAAPVPPVPPKPPAGVARKRITGSQKKVSQRHRDGLAILQKGNQAVVTVVEGRQWRVTPSTPGVVHYLVTRDLQRPFCNCALRCDNCSGLCAHMYQCGCPDVHSLCKHIHACFLFARDNAGSAAQTGSTETEGSDVDDPAAVLLDESALTVVGPRMSCREVPAPEDSAVPVARKVEVQAPKRPLCHSPPAAADAGHLPGEQLDVSPLTGHIRKKFCELVSGAVFQEVEVDPTDFQFQDQEQELVDSVMDDECIKAVMVLDRLGGDGIAVVGKDGKSAMACDILCRNLHRLPLKSITYFSRFTHQPMTEWSRRINEDGQQGEINHGHLVLIHPDHSPEDIQSALDSTGLDVNTVAAMWSFLKDRTPVSFDGIF